MTELLPTYIGDCEIQETERSDMRVDVYGLDTFVQGYQGRKDKAKVADFLRRLKAAKTNSQVALPTWGFQITDYPGFSISDFSYHTDRSWAYFDVQFVGKVDNSEPEPNKTDDWTENTISFYVGVDTPIPAEVDYRAPKTLYRYATKTRPTAPRYAGVVASGELPIQIIAKRGIAGLFSLTDFRVTQRSYMTQFQRTQIGNWWQVTEEHELRFVQDLEFTTVVIPT